MMRLVAALLAGVALLTAAVAVEYRLRQIDATAPHEAGRELLFVPSQEALRLLSLGNEGLMADILYLWAIQYYSVYEPDERFLYLETMLDLITDLDPRYYDAYAIGGLILGQAALKEPERRPALAALYEKGIAARPDDYLLAERAAWDFHTLFNDSEQAIHFATIAASRPGAPNRILRVLGSWKDANHVWSVEESIQYWRRAEAEAPNEREASYCRSHLYDVVIERDRRELDPMLKTRAALDGSCPQSWQVLIRAGVVDSEPLDAWGQAYSIDQASCSIYGHRKIRD